MTGEVYKHKGYLNIHDNQQVYGEHYWETFSAVARWSSICLLIIIALLTGMYTRQYNFLLAYPHADISIKQWMKIPVGVQLEEGLDPKDYVLEANKNIYGGKDSGLQWSNHLHLAWRASDLLNLPLIHVFTSRKGVFSLFMWTMSSL